MIKNGIKNEIISTGIITWWHVFIDYWKLNKVTKKNIIFNFILLIKYLIGDNLNLNK